MKKLIPILAAVLVVLILAGVFLAQCNSGANTPDPTVPATQPTQPSTDPKPTVPAPTEPAPTVPAPTEPVPTVPPTNPLTGEPLDALSEYRPFAIVFNNIKAAQPQLGVSLADILCEVMTEGGTTRCVGLFHTLPDTPTFGSIRSARPYMISLVQSFDAVFVHAGCSAEAKQLFEDTGWDHLDGVYGKNASKYFYRDQDRLNAGYSKEHTMCITPEKIREYAQAMNLTLTRPTPVQYGWQFADNVSLTGSAAQQIRIRFTLGASTAAKVKATVMDYNAETGLYDATQFNKPWEDGTVKEQIAFKNVLVLRCDTQKLYPTESLLKVEMVGSGTGYYAVNGQMVPICWNRATTADPFTFTLEDGTPLTLATGKTYIGFVSTKSVIDFS